MNKENKKLVAILDKATRNGWECSLKTTKQCNRENTLIMLMTTKLYSRVSAEAYDWTLYDDTAEINSNQEEPAKSPSGSATGSAPESQEEETEEADTAAAKKSNRSDAESKEEKPGAVGGGKSDETPITANDVLDSKDENKGPPQKKRKTTAAQKKANKNPDKKEAASVSPPQRKSPRKKKIWPTIDENEGRGY